MQTKHIPERAHQLHIEVVVKSVTSSQRRFSSSRLSAATRTTWDSLYMDFLDWSKVVSSSFYRVQSVHHVVAGFVVGRPSVVV